MDARQSVLPGAVGGIALYLITLLSPDAPSVASGSELRAWISLAVCGLVLIVLGLRVARRSGTASPPFNRVRPGLAAAALLAVLLNGSAGNGQPLAPYSISLIASAHAGDDVHYINAGLLREPRISGFARFLRVALGTHGETAENAAWFVIVGAHQSRQHAETQAQGLEKQHYEAHVYRPRGGAAHYAVVIASHVSQQEAQTIRDQAVRDGLPQDSYVWRD